MLMAEIQETTEQHLLCWRTNIVQLLYGIIHMPGGAKYGERVYQVI